MATEFTIDMADWKRQAAAIKRDYGASVKVGLREGFKPLTRDLIKYSWPRKKGDGNRAVAADVSRALIAVKHVRDKSKLRNAGLDPNPKTFHKAARYPKSGRVRKEFRGPGWSGAKRLLVPSVEARALTREIQNKDVGTLKGGWEDAAAHMKVKMAAWMKGHKWRGKYREQIDQRTGNGWIEAENTVPWSGFKLRDVVPFVIKLQESNFKRRLEAAIKRAMDKASAR